MTKPLLTIGMSTYDDYDGVYFSLMAIRTYHSEVLEHIEFLILDNNPDSPSGKAVKAFAKSIPQARYLPFRDFNSTASRDLLFREARTEWVLCMDSHVLFLPSVLSRLLSYFSTKIEARDLFQGPLVYDNLHDFSTHFDPEWNAGMYGRWGSDERAADPDAAPFVIAMQGLGVFACRKKAWPGFNARFRGFGGEEGYIHEKFRRGGGEVICLPFLRWVHRFNRPLGTQYPNLWEDRVRNYFIGHQELALPTADLERHFSDLLGETHFRQVKQRIKEEIDSPFFHFEAIYWLPQTASKKEQLLMEGAFIELGIDHLVRKKAGKGSAAYQQIFQKARQFGYEKILIFRGFLSFKKHFVDRLAADLNQLAQKKWKIHEVKACEGRQLKEELIVAPVVAVSRLGMDHFSELVD